MRQPTTRRWFSLAAVAIAATAALAGCGSDDSGGTDTAGAATGAAAGNDVVGIETVDGVGTVLVDGSGKALYFSEQEKDGTIACVDACLGFWTPAAAGGSLPDDIEGLDTVRRDDTGDRQLTLDGAPLYTFSLDKSPGQVTGDNLSDSFGGVDFTWHAAVTDDAGAASNGGDNGGDNGGYGGNPYDY